MRIEANIPTKKERRYYTFLSFSFSTVGIWVQTLGLTLGLQFEHSRYPSPYLYFDWFLGRVMINEGEIQIDKSDRGVPPVYTRTHTIKVVKHV